MTKLKLMTLIVTILMTTIVFPGLSYAQDDEQLSDEIIPPTQSSTPPVIIDDEDSMNVDGSEEN